MDCKTTKPRLQELLDRALGEREEREVRLHLEACPACFKEYGLLRLFADSMARLAYRSPSPRFNAKVLAALGLGRAEERLPDWTAWFEELCIASASCWTAITVCWLGSLTSLPFAASLAWLVLHPQKLLGLLRSRTLEWGHALAPLLKILSSLARVLPPLIGRSHLPFQLAVATILAGMALLAISRDASWKTAT